MTQVDAAAARDALRRVSWLAPLGEAVHEQIAAAASTLTLATGQILVAELEAGDAVFILLSGTAEVTVADQSPPAAAPTLLAAGAVVGEIAFLLGTLHTETVTAKEPVTALRLDYPVLRMLIGCFPAIASGMIELLAARLKQTETALRTLLQSGPLPAATPGVARPQRRSLTEMLHEALAARQHDAAFLALTAFLGILILVRAGVGLAEHFGVALLPVLRTAYLSGILLVVVSTALLLFRFRPGSRRLAALGYGAGFALIFNELSVFLAFDIFWSDMTHRDPSVVFDPVRLYARAEGHYAVGIALAVLLQVTYLRKFYQRAWVAIKGRLGRLFTRRS